VSALLRQAGGFEGLAAPPGLRALALHEADALPLVLELGEVLPAIVPALILGRATKAAGMQMYHI
jgi:hypothetical protein